jgi:hypothetical protein
MLEKLDYGEMIRASKGKCLCKEIDIAYEVRRENIEFFSLSFLKDD